MRIRTHLITLLRIRILAFNLIRIRIQIITLIRIRIQLIILIRIRIVPFNLIRIRIRIHNTVQVVTVSCPRLERLNLAACGWIRPEALEYHAQHHFRHRTIHLRGIQLMPALRSPIHRVDRVLSFFSSRRNWDSPIPPQPQASVPPPLPPGFGGGSHSLVGERGSPNSDEGKHTVVLHLCLYFVVLKKRYFNFSTLYTVRACGEGGRGVEDENSHVDKSISELLTTPSKGKFFYHMHSLGHPGIKPTRRLNSSRFD
jgi:hypothetical protein